MNDDEIIYGPYTDVAPFSVSPMRLHFEHNAAFAHVTKLVREMTVRVRNPTN